jgi:hypothetical protein
MRGVAVYGRSGYYHADDVMWSEDRNAYLHEDDAVNIRDEYYYDGDLTRISAFECGRRRWVNMDDCEEVEVFQADEHSGLVILEQVNTFTMYRDNDGRLHDGDDALECWQHDNGEIIGEVE